MRLGIDLKLGLDPSLPASEVPDRCLKPADGKELPTPLSGNRCAKTFIGRLRHSLAIC